jgi:CO/xanthine dehydrogenase FAD-binding subunit
MKNVKEYFTPTTILDAVMLLRAQPGKGRFIAGGTNLVVDKDPTLEYLIDLHQLGLEYLIEEQDWVRIGACTTIQDLYQSSLICTLADGLLAQVASWFGSRQIRNVATLGGNIAEGFSAADTAPALLAMDARVVLMGERERVVPIAEFFPKAGGTVLDQELITEILIPKIFQQARGKFQKEGKTHEDIAIVSVAATMIMDGAYCEQARIALGAVAPTPIRIPEAEQIVTGEIPTPELIQYAADMVAEQIHPIDNFRASAQFRRDLSRTFTVRALSACVGRSV